MRAAQARLGRSLAILHIDAGSCGGCEIELRALTACRPRPGALRPGLRLQPAPCRCAAGDRAGDAQPGGGAGAGLDAAMPDPKFVVAVGDCAVDGGVFKGSYAVAGGVGTTLPVDLLISGCPPTPERILAGLRALLEANARS